MTKQRKKNSQNCTRL